MYGWYDYKQCKSADETSVTADEKGERTKKEQVFVVEGIKMFQEAPADTVVSVYVSESFLEKPEHEKCLQGYRYEVVSDAVFREISDTQTPQGILAIVRMPKYDLPDLLQGITRIFNS